MQLSAVLNVLQLLAKRDGDAIHVRLIAAVRYENDRFFEFRPVYQLYKCPSFVLLPAALHDCIQIELTFQVVQSVQMQQVVSASVPDVVKRKALKSCDFKAFLLGGVFLVSLTEMGGIPYA